MVISYPGVVGANSLSGSLTVGITPGVFVIRCYPRSSPAIMGTLTFAEEPVGRTAYPPVQLLDCFTLEVDRTMAESANFVTVSVADRRWRWQQGYGIDGHWNQVDSRKKLIPLTVASPWQLAKMLLAKMGETGYSLDLPGGLAQPADPARGIPAPGPFDTVIRPQGEFYRCGQNLPVSQTNPVTTWLATPAAQALANLVEPYGRTVAFNVVTNTVAVVPYGTSLFEPPDDGVWMSDGSSRRNDPKPANVIAQASATRYQVRIPVRAVGPDWDGTWRDWGRISYAPSRAGQTMVVTVTGTGTYDNSKTYGVRINNVPFTSVGAGTWAATVTALRGSINGYGGGAVSGKVTAADAGPVLTLTGYADGYEFEVDLTTDSSPGIATTGQPTGHLWVGKCTAGPIPGPVNSQPVWVVTYPNAYDPATDALGLTVNGHTVYASIGAAADLPSACRLLAAEANADASIGAVSVSEWDSTTVLVTGLAAGTAVSVSGSTTGAGTVTAANVAGTTYTPKGFERTFNGSLGYAAVATDRLNYQQARALTVEHLHRSFQVLCQDPADPAVKAIPVPGYAGSPVTDRHRLILQTTRPEPVTPAPGDINVFDLRTAQPWAAETYNGYATDKPNIAFGSVSLLAVTRDGLLWTGGASFGNTAPRLRLPIPFTIIDPEHQVIRFAQPLYRLLGEGAGFACLPADLVIEVGVTVLAPGGRTPEAIQVTYAAGGPGPDLVRIVPEIEQEVIGVYDSRHAVTGSYALNARSQEVGLAYAAGVANTFQTVEGRRREYSGVRAIPLDGLVRQVTWELGESTVKTTVGVSAETSRAVLPPAARRRAENLDQDAVRRLQNLASDYYSRVGEWGSALKARLNSLGRPSQ